jgi:hypothetical protein
MRKAEISEFERVKMENYALRTVFMQQQLQQIQIERATFVQEMEAAHPGYEWQDPYGLVEKQEETVEA